MSLILSTVPSNQQVTCNLSWSGSAPGDVIDYIIFYYVSGSAQINSKATQSLSTNITGLTNDNVYNFYAVAYESSDVNGQSLGQSNVSQSIPASLPSAPTGLAGVVSTSGNIISGQVVLSWNASTTDSHYPILNYNVYQSSDNVTFNLIAQPNALTYTVSGLTNGSTYYFAVSSTSAIGSSAKCSSISEVPLGLASAPLNLVVNYDPQVSQNAQLGYQKVDLSYQAPASNGGTAITGYIIEYSLDNTFATGVTSVNNAGTTDAIQNASLVTPYADRNLTTGWYFFRVCAVTNFNGNFCNPVTIAPSANPVAVQ